MTDTAGSHSLLRSPWVLAALRGRVCRGAVLERGRAGEGLSSPRSELSLSVSSGSLPSLSLSVSLPPWGPHTSGPTTTAWGPPGRSCAGSGVLTDLWHLTCDQDVQGVTGGRPLGGEVLSTIACVPAAVGGSHRVQVEVRPREPSVGLPAKAPGRVTCSLLGQSESVVANIRATLEGQALSRGHDRALLAQEGGLARHTWERPAVDCRG